MKSAEFITEGIAQNIDKMLDKWNLELGGPHPVGHGGPAYNFFDRKASSRKWTRGDGARYREPAYFTAVKWDEAELKKMGVKLKNTVEIMDWAWKQIGQMPNAKPFKVSGEFGNDKYDPAYKVGKYVFIRRGPWGQNPGIIAYATTSILRNLDVWRQEK